MQLIVRTLKTKLKMLQRVSYTKKRITKINIEGLYTEIC